ncbi:exo-rhamnogalacturonan lyase family protein [Actinoalloteichus hymeniacidonis]|uniref:Tat pathway signal sequence domain protein n=1 Tax=Actinoalloteichus hymeniacidonis TaxID=340345 RepID=A0AAC9HQU6_9PSEU|nr:Tat pathway signal sequence domain protein [Actinoalloteichus hymeniacidonis]AOS63291.1 hypothetical protein TL08_12385 [Actinoalloteichus hymeniacidonis]MBB5908670.1 hypothetical protein [Actinoalloteichus hymeniacidonis]
MPGFGRRGFLAGTVAAGAAAQLPWLGTPIAAAAQDSPAAPDEVRLGWLEGGAPAETPGTTWGVPWPKGALPADQPFALHTESGEAVPVQTWPIGYWPDGSLKWSAHSVGPHTAAEGYRLTPGDGAAPQAPVTVQEDNRTVTVDTGVIQVRIPRRGSTLVESISRDGVEIARAGELILIRGDSPEDGDEGTSRRERFIGRTDTVTVEQTGPVRAVVRVSGIHRARRGGREMLPFTVRLYFHAGAENLRMMHSFVFDRDGQEDFVHGLGVRFQVPMRDQTHDRHIRFAGQDGGLHAEAVKGLTGLRRDPGEEVRSAQVAGQPTPPVATFPDNVRTRLHLIPDWGDHSLSQSSSESFQVRKRTKEGHAWISVDSGGRAAGLGYVGGISGGLAFGLRDFWQRHPTQLDVRNAASDTSEATVWLYSPDAKPMDLRFFHDGLGQDTYEEQLEALEITYEDYEPGFGTAEGIARTSELLFWALPATPSSQRLAAMSTAVSTPPLLTAPPAHLHGAGVFGDWSPVDRSTPAKAEIEDRLDFLFDFYRDQIDQRHWYGFWDYGDVMHTYDADRHVWRYDVGGYAWDNSELGTDIWLWLHYLRTGSAQAFRLAEAMVRHTGEVDVYHSGPYEKLGTRHNVQHFGCSAKQVRISTVANRRYYYFLTADERVGDLMHAQIDVDQTFLTLDPSRKVRDDVYEPDPNALSIGTGTDWSALAIAWLTEWERGGDPIAKEKLLAGVETIPQLPHGFYTDGERYDIDTGRYHLLEDHGISVSHLNAVFGQVELCSELIDLLDDPAFTEAWLQYCRLYNATAEEQEAELGESLGNLNLGQGHSRLTAYAAHRLDDAALAERAWAEFFGGAAGYGPDIEWTTTRIEGEHSLNPVDEATFVSTNASAQYGLAAIQNLALIGDRLPN